MREIVDLIEEMEDEEFFLPAEESVTTAQTQSGLARRTFNIVDSRSLYELTNTVNTGSLMSFYVRIHEGHAYNMRLLFGQWLLYDSTNSPIHYSTVISRLNVGADDSGMATKVKLRLAGNLDVTTVTAAQLEAIDLLILLGVCEGIRLGGNVTTFLHTLERIEAGNETFVRAFTTSASSYVPARKEKGTGQEKHLRGLNTKVKRKKGTAHQSAGILREFSGLKKGKKREYKHKLKVSQKFGRYTCRPDCYGEWRRRSRDGTAEKYFLLLRQRMGFDLEAQGPSAPSMPYIT